MADGDADVSVNRGALPLCQTRGRRQFAERSICAD